ncbi:MAG: nucleotide exchange factor GrpE [Polyangiales bacterium]|nr:nucleotide exchange factor GrpE [Myxococcales bacterium]MCB9659361.1 nucleotide exchange factor GrpE [Sandaracinaceae bacterium]
MSDQDENPTPNDESTDAPGANEGAVPGAEGAAAEVLSPLEQVTAERDKLKDQLLRTMADFDNFRKRARRDAEDALRRGREDSLRDILPIIDNLERAVEASRGATDVAAVISGIEMVLRSFDDVAARMGATRIVAKGERFDPTLHDAIQQVESAEHPPGTVLTEVVAGYRLGERLLRAAMVVVSKAPSAPAPEAVSDAGTESE